MNALNIECPKCRSRMEDGFIVDSTHGGSTQSQWAAGQPVKSFWTGLKLRGQRMLKVATYRCTSCGYLESYAK